MPAPRKYNDELRERAVRTVHETIKENPGIPVKRACNQVGEQLGIPVPRQVVGRISSCSKVGVVVLARPRWTSRGRF
ncbi:hypothetical protein, partial [Tessaracoccus flavus]|uniref:hypothetical protein n=1 Tax=Tessaracoccus flavus TaxID=1610493 RepID=UPI00089B8738